MVFYTNKFIPDRFAGYTIGGLIFIRPEYKEDKGLLAHERIHVKQFWKSFGLHSILYSTNKEYRLKSEVEAYKEQLRYYTVDKVNLFAEYLSTKYNLGISKEEAIKLLKGNKV